MEIPQIIKERAISILFQPIQNVLTKEIIGFEALARVPGKLFFPLNLFHAARKAGMFQQMEMLCFSMALEEAACLPDSTEVFINISPETFIQCHEDISRLIQDSNDKVVLELAEIGLNTRQQKLLAAILTDMRNQGTKVALDDIGSGDRNFRNICEIPSDYLKIDRGIIEGLTKHHNGSAPHYLAALKALVSIAKDLNSNVIAEGVETPLQLAAVKEAGICLVQGFIISKPKPADHWIGKKKEVTVC